MIQFREVADRYNLEKILKSSRTGSLFRATDSASGEAVAVKLLPLGAAPEAEVAELQRAFEILEANPHPSLPVCRDFGVSSDGSAFLVMEFLEGRSFEAVIGNPPKRILQLLEKVAEGLELLERKGLAHRNLSPDNLYLVPPDRGSVKILGWGTAIVRRPAAAGNDPQTARFRAPEDLAAPAGVPGAKTDAYSFVKVACRVLGIPISREDSPEPQVDIPFALGFELDQVDALRMAFQAALHRDPAERPSLTRLRTVIRRSLSLPDADVAKPTPAAPKGPVKVPAIPVPVPVPAPAPAPALRETVLPALGAPAAEAAGDETGGELLSTIEDDFLNEPAEAPEPAPAAAASPPVAAAGPVRVPSYRPPTPTAAAPVPKSRLRGLLRPLPLALAAGALLLLLGGGFWWWLHRAAPEVPAETFTAPLKPIPPPPPPAETRLAEAREHLAAGNDFAAFAALRSLSGADQARLAASCEEIRFLEEALALSLRENLGRELAAVFAAGDGEALRHAVAAAEELAGGKVSPETAAQLEKARQVGALYREAEAAALAREPLQVLARFGAMAALVPGLRDGSGLRDKAADAVEAEADELAREARYDEVMAKMEPVVRTWPDREGLTEKMAGYRSLQQSERTVSALLNEAANLERRRKPEQGLALLEKAEPTPHLAPRYQEVRQRLQAQLARIDGRPPTVQLRDGFLLEYDRGTVVSLSFRIRDDYQVKSVKIYARAGSGGKMVSLPYQKSNFGYSVEIAPGFHRNETVQLYVVATDVSGHEGSLGSAAQPLQIKRRKGFREG